MKLRTFLAFLFNVVAMWCFGWLMLHAELSIYLLKMGQGQLHILTNTRDIQEVLQDPATGPEEREKLLFVEKIKKYSVDSLAYKPTRNFTTYFNQEGRPLLWIVTACKPFAFEAYEWDFPLIGSVSYKGFFNPYLARREYLRLAKMGYDADVSPVSAWSTLGWLPDPVLSGMLRRSKGKLANLLFHELFHATYYAPGTVDVNENLANFISYKATLKFLAGDTGELNRFMEKAYDDSLYNAFVFAEFKGLETFYRNTASMDSAARLKKKERALLTIYKKAAALPLKYPSRYEGSNRSIMEAKNAFFIDARRYDGLYDSLNNVLNNVYKGNLRAMIEGLKK